jgi:hypothetical protein
VDRWRCHRWKSGNVLKTFESNVTLSNYSIPRFQSRSARPGCCRRWGRTRPATKSFEPRGCPAGAESKASFAENAFHEEFWIADLTSAQGWILRLIRAPFATSCREGQTARHQPRHGRNSQAAQQNFLPKSRSRSMFVLMPPTRRRSSIFEPRRFDRWDRA